MPPRILVTNDDGINGGGLHALARAMAALGEVVVVAPDAEYSGASAALGPLHLIRPEVHETEVDALAGVRGVTATWAVSGPPALCVYFARLGAFGEGEFDLVAAGINPGANVGRSVQHSGTVGAAVTALGGGVSAVAVSQDAAGSVEGQADAANPPGQMWDSAAAVAQVVARSLLEAPPSPAVAINVNVPNLPLDEVKGWQRTTIAGPPRRGVGGATLVPVEGAAGTYRVRMRWERPGDLPTDTDVGAVAAGLVSVSVLTGMVAADPSAPLPAGPALDELVGPA